MKTIAESVNENRHLEMKMIILKRENETSERRIAEMDTSIEKILWEQNKAKLAFASQNARHSIYNNKIEQYHKETNELWKENGSRIAKEIDGILEEILRKRTQMESLNKEITILDSQTIPIERENMIQTNTKNGNVDEEVIFLSPDGEVLCDTDQDVEIQVEFIESEIIDSYSKQKQAKKSKYEDLENRSRPGRKTKYGMTREARKLMYNTNKPYINTKGKEVEPRAFDENFKCTCKKRCTEVVKLEERKKLFNEFWNIGSFSARCLLLQQHIEEFPKKRTYTKNASRRQFSRKYYISNVEICKMAFLKTLQIHSNRVDVALQKRHDEVIVDMRGTKSGGWNKCKKEQIDGVVEHINNFLGYISECRKHQSETQQFKSSQLNLKRMYVHYRDSCENVIPVSHSTYKLIFYRHFNRRVKSPQKMLAKCRKNQTQDETEDFYKDYDGQRRAEKLSRIIITLFGVVGLVWGYIIQQFSQTVYILGAGFVLAALITIPPWPMYRRKPLQWQKPRPENDSSDQPTKSKKKK